MPLTDGHWAKVKRENAYLLQQDLGNIRLDGSERTVPLHLSGGTASITGPDWLLRNAAQFAPFHVSNVI